MFGLNLTHREANDFHVPSISRAHHADLWRLFVDRLEQLTLFSHLTKLLLKVGQLFAEAKVRIYSLSPFLDQRQRITNRHAILEHQVSDDAAGAARNSRVTAILKRAHLPVHKNRSTRLHRFLNELGRFHEMLAKILPGHIHHVQHFVLEGTGKLWLHSTHRLKNVSYAFTFEGELVLRSFDIAEVEVWQNAIDRH